MDSGKKRLRIKTPPIWRHFHSNFVFLLLELYTVQNFPLRLCARYYVVKVRRALGHVVVLLLVGQRDRARERLRMKPQKDVVILTGRRSEGKSAWNHLPAAFKTSGRRSLSHHFQIFAVDRSGDEAAIILWLQVRLVLKIFRVVGIVDIRTWAWRSENDNWDFEVVG